jgi:hypothetical protein
MFLACLANLPKATRLEIRQSQGSKPNVAAVDALAPRSAGTHIVMQAVKSADGYSIGSGQKH